MFLFEGWFDTLILVLKGLLNENSVMRDCSLKGRL